jgi:hypothetical protein
MLRIIGTMLVFILVIIVLLALGSGLLFLLAYGVGWVVNLMTHFEPFQATALALASILVFGILAERIWQALTSPTPLSSLDDDDEYDEEDDEYEEEEDEEPIFINPRIPRWRQPLKSVDFSNIKPDDRCPCGSGRKYKNCHGRKQT